MRTVETTFLWIIKIGLWLIPFIPLIVSPSMLFPFITGKNFTFRILIEAIFVLWAALAMLRAEYRPRLTPLFKAVTIFIVIVFFADLFGPNPYRSFFSNYERMEGFMMIFHLYLYFVMLFTLFTKRDWLIFFHSTIIASLLVSYIGLTQKLGWRISLQGGFRVDSTIGNPTYLAAYLLFHVWVFLILMYTFWRKWWLEILYALGLIFELSILFFTATRGALLALVLTSILFLLSLAIFWKQAFPSFSEEGRARSLMRRSYTRKLLGILLVISILIPAALFLARKTDFVKSQPVLDRLTNYEIREGTIVSRFMIWNMSWQGFQERPIFGWGQENYYLVFQKYYDPGLYGEEPWFDRSHNIFFDWLIHAGFLGFAAFFGSIFVAFFGLFAAARKKLIPLWHALVLGAVFLSYLFQNLFVFDNLNTYLLLFGFLAYTGYLISPREETRARGALTQNDYARAFTFAGVLAVILLFASPFLHARPINQSKTLLSALRAVQMGAKGDELIELFKRSLSYDSIGNTEVREQIGNIARDVAMNERFSEEEKKRFVAFAADELRKETGYAAKDVKHLLFLGAILNRALALDPSYVLLSTQALEEAVRLSPAKQMIGFELAQLYVLLDRPALAVDIIEKQYRMAPDIQDVQVNLLVLAVVTGRDDLIEEILPLVKINRLAEQNAFRLGTAFRNVENYIAAIPFYERLIEESSENPQYHATLAALYGNAGRIEDARRHAEIAASKNPDFAAESEVFLKMLEKK